jgi:hypothetical protein
MMKTIVLITLLLFVASGLVAQRQSAPAAASAKLVLFDFRTTRPISTPKITPATERMVLSKLFRRYLTDPAKCDANFDPGSASDPLLAARNAGQATPSITDVATGSFTATGQKQTLYVISVSECNASHAENFGTSRVAIFSGQQLLANLDVNFRNSIVKKLDLNGDGIDELLMAGGDTHQGITTEVAALLEFPNGRLHVIRDFGTVSIDECASEERGSTTKAAVIYQTDELPGIMPKLRVENYVQGCGKSRRWRFLSNGKMPE